jgi:hypothetical protein
MAVRVVGAGLGRTGTNSLKLALERLLDGRCYHMYELIERPQDTERWESAVAGEPVDWNSLLSEYRATVDFPAAVSGGRSSRPAPTPLSCSPAEIRPRHGGRASRGRLSRL